jgi:hypothetical protein
MQVHVVVRVDVIELEARGTERLELGADLRLELAPHARPEEEAQAGGDQIFVERPPGIDEVGHGLGREDRATLHEHEMEPHPEARQAAGALHRVVGRRGADHQARRAEHPLAVRALDRLVDRHGETEVVAGEDDAPRRTIPARPTPHSETARAPRPTGPRPVSAPSSPRRR